MKVKTCLLGLVTCVALTIFIGCEGDWTSGGGVGSWDESYNAVNFSGVYRRSGPGYLVSDYTGVGTVSEVLGNTSGGQGPGTPVGPASKSDTFAIGADAVTLSRTLSSPPVVPGSVAVAAPGLSFSDNGAGSLSGTPRGTGTIVYTTGELLLNFVLAPGAGNVTVTYVQQAPTSSPGVTNFANAGLLSKPPVVPGSLSISVGTAFVLRDNGAGGLTSGSGITGTIDYNTGAWTIDYGSATVPPNATISAAYRSYGGQGRGTTGLDIFTFTVHHEGQHLRIVDNTGAVYDGRMGSIRTSSGQDATAGVPLGGTLIAQFTATGTSKAGYPVTMAGTFQGEILDSDSPATPEYTGLEQKLLSSRKMIGTWIESGGKTGDIVGDASPITIYSPGDPAGTTPSTPATPAEGTTTEPTTDESANI